MPSSFANTLGNNVTNGTASSNTDGCVEGGVLMYGKNCTVECEKGFAPSPTSTLVYTCNAARGGDVAFDTTPSITCIPGMTVCLSRVQGLRALNPNPKL